jgi:hypothetical protein
VVWRMAGQRWSMHQCFLRCLQGGCAANVVASRTTSQRAEAAVMACPPTSTAAKLCCGRMAGVVRPRGPVLQAGGGVVAAKRGSVKLKSDGRFWGDGTRYQGQAEGAPMWGTTGVC